MKAIIAVTKDGFTPYGKAEDYFYSKQPEIIISGPYDTGKTITALNKMNLLMSLFPKSRGLMVRKTYKSLINSAVVTFEEKVHGNKIDTPSYPVKKLGKSKPEWYDYPNGSRLVLGGLDNPAKTLSAEYDFIYVNQVEELLEDEWQSLTRAASGRSGHSPYTQVMGDCNPDVPNHWILTRERISFYESRHEDNPTIYDQDTGELIAPGRIETLDAMTGVRKKRGRYGLWVGRAGQVYEFDPAVHLIDRFDIPGNWRRYMAIDFGYTNPFVCQWWAENGDGVLYMYREIYMSKRTVKTHSRPIREFIHGTRFEDTVADHDAEDRATLHENGIITRPADKRISVGIEKVQERLKIQSNGKPRLFILRDSLVEVDESLKSNNRPYSTVSEFPGYVWPEIKAQRAADEKPIKSDDHGMDAMRYMVMLVDNPPATLETKRYA